jgi:hypothetical protein
MTASAGREDRPDRSHEISDPGRVERHDTTNNVLLLFRQHVSMRQIAKTLNLNNRQPLTSPLQAWFQENAWSVPLHLGIIPRGS